jgi:hypothetical protein
LRGDGDEENNRTTLEAQPPERLAHASGRPEMQFNGRRRRRETTPGWPVAAAAISVIVGCGGDTGDARGAGGDAAASSASSSSAARTSTATIGSSSSASSAASGGLGGAGGGGGALPTGLVSQVTDTRFYTADAMLAAAEMQISGEPFAELLGRQLSGYDRFSSTTDMYVDPATGSPTLDPLGFCLAVESYEYSKQPMNDLSFESGAGLSLMYSPRINPSRQTGDPAVQLLLDRLQYLALASRASGARLGRDFVTSPAPTNDPTNVYGWPGFWPSFAEYRSFDPTIAPSVGADHQCSLAGATDEPLPPGTVVTYVGDYECDSNTLNLPNRDAQVEKVLEPAALGLAAWKQGLWVINYWSSLHDVDQDPIVSVQPTDLASVGVPDNQVTGQWPSPLDPTGQTLVFGMQGTYLGDVSLEGWQGLVMLEELDGKSTALLQQWTTTDGATLGGFASTADAIDYDFQSPIRFWPSAIAVTETATAMTAADANRYFPAPTDLEIATGSSRLEDLTGLLLGFSEYYAMTDATNPDVGGTQPFLATFDGAPFAADDGVPDGEDTPHDRALAILKVALVDLDRLHFDAAHGALVDEATVDGEGAPVRGTTATTSRAAYAIVALRNAHRALDGSLTLYSNDTPDALGAPEPLDQASLAGAPYTGTLGDHVTDLIRAEADLLSNTLLDASGNASNGVDLATGVVDPSPTTIESQAAAIRGLLEAYLATSDETYRQRATEAYAALAATFWMDDVRAYRTSAGESSTMTWTPRSFGTLHGALRQLWKLVGSRPGDDALSAELLDRIERGMKLVVDGWNDTNGDGLVDPSECMAGRLQMAERALTGEFSIAADGGDRDHDCVPDVATAKLPAALAGELVIRRR